MKAIKKIINCENTWPFSSYAKKYKRYENRINYDQVFKKPFIFVTGTPRSGTSLITKIIDAHPDIAMIMENIFGNRRRHWQRAPFWEDQNALRHVVYEFYKKFQEPILGNKVCTPDVWSAEDTVQFCSLFENFKIITVVRDPRAVVISRHNREEISHFNELAKKNLLLDFSCKTRTYLSSWRQCLETQSKLKEFFNNRVTILYYEDLCKYPDIKIKELFDFLGVKYHNDVMRWNKIPHYNSAGKKAFDLKYKDKAIFSELIKVDQVPYDYNLSGIEEAWFKLYEKREL